LGVEVEVGEPPGGGQRREPGEAGVAAGFGGGDLDVEEPFKERGVAEVGFGGVVQLAGQGFRSRGEPQVGEMGAQTLICRVVAHDAPCTRSA
jgi:hypothetical protein